MIDIEDLKQARREMKLCASMSTQRPDTDTMLLAVALMDEKIKQMEFGKIFNQMLYEAGVIQKPIGCSNND